MKLFQWRLRGLALGWFCVFLSFTSTAIAGDMLSDVLKEKGVLSKEDWIRVQAAKEKEEAAQKKMIFSLGEEGPVKAGWGKKGFTLETIDGKWKTALQWRFQGRYSYPERSDPTSASAFADGAESTFELRRVRMKIGGHGFEPWIKYYFEVDLQGTRDYDDDAAGNSTRVIDWRITLEKFKWAQVRVGQWKINYNRERVDSSGKQQFVERSIVNRDFTIDRQMGVMVMGHLFPGTRADSWYYAGVFTGEGRGVDNDDDNMMYMGRLQWNFLGRDLKFSQSDVEYHENPTGSIAGGYYTTIGTCTRWSSSGCGSLAGFNSPSTTVPGQFRLDGFVEELAFKWRGFSLQHEFHWKQIKDAGRAGVTGTTMLPTTSFVSAIAPVTPSRTNMMGSYSQVGYFPHYLISAVPKPLEVAVRYAFVDPNVHMTNDLRQEFTGALNWFFAGHRNKITIDASHLTLDVPTGPATTEQRVRLQWDVSF